jgi:hypothetical protein
MEKKIAVETAVVIVVNVDGEFKNWTTTAEIAEKYEKAKNSTKLADKLFVQEIAMKVLRAEVNAAKKAETAKRPKVTRAQVVATVIAEDISKIDDTDHICSRVAELGKVYGIEPNEDEVRKYNLPKVRETYRVILSQFVLTAK